MSNHFSTENALNKAKKRYGYSNIEYHLVIGRIQSDPREYEIRSDSVVSDTEIFVMDIKLSDFNDEDIRKGIIAKVIKLLTYGTEPPRNDENKQYRNMNKKLIRLTESDLHRIVRESVNRVLNEIGDTPYGQYMLGRAANRALGYPDGDDTFSDLKKKAKESAFNSGLAPYADGRHTPYFFDGDEDQENFEKQVDMMNKGRGDDVKLNQAKDTIRNNASRYYNDSGLGKKSPTQTITSNDDAAAKMKQQRMNIRNRYRM